MTFQMLIKNLSFLVNQFDAHKLAGRKRRCLEEERGELFQTVTE